MKLTDVQIQKAVKWWMDALRNPKFDMQGAGPKDPRLSLCEMIVTYTRADFPEEDQKITAFGAELAKLLRGKEIPTTTTILRVDYAACEILQAAAMAAGIRVGMNTFPWKTAMYADLDGETATVSCGYGAAQAPI